MKRSSNNRKWSRHMALATLPMAMMAVMACAKPANAMPWQSTTVTAASDSEQEGGITIVTTGDNLAQPYYVVDGKHITDVSHIKADDIQSITVLKGKQATDKYGKAAKGGAIEVTLKKWQHSPSSQRAAISRGPTTWWTGSMSPTSATSSPNT